MLADDTIRAVLRTSWHLQPDGLTPLTGGVNTYTWLVSTGTIRYIAKSIHYSRQPQIVAGLSAAEHLSRLGLPAGMPLRCLDGALSAPLLASGGGLPGAGLESADTVELPSVSLIEPAAGPRVMVVLQHEAGRPLNRNDSVDQLWWGDRLAACHRSLSAFTHPGAAPWQSVRVDAAHLGLQSWLRPAVRDALEATEKLMVLDRLTFGFLHGDPCPQAFLLDESTGRVGIVGWGHVAVGPLLCDLASAVMYAGGYDQAGPLVEAYTAAGVVPKAELESALPTLVRMRWAMQADYLARRLAHRSTADDLHGLVQARDALLG